MDSHGKIWAPLRTKTAKIAGVAVALSLIGLWQLHKRQPSAIPSVRETETGKIDPALFGAIEVLLETALAIGAISLLFELFLREEYARTLRRYLRLGASLVRSGLQDILRSPDLDWAAVIEPASTITALVRDPSQWLIPSLKHITDAAQKRKVDVTIGFPDPEGSLLQTIAETVGLDAATLKQNIDTAVKSIENQWQAQKPHFKDGSEIRVVAYSGVPLHEVLAGDEITVCLVAQAINHPVGEWQMALAFEQRDDQYPSQLLRQALKDLGTMNELWAGDTT